MTNNATHTDDHHLTLTSRITSSLLNRRLLFFAAELILIVAGVLIALAIDEWVSDARDRRTETLYLQLLTRDLDEIRQRLDEQLAFEQNLLDKSARVYARLSEADPSKHEAEIGRLLGSLGTRKTLSLTSATYSEMVDSGRLQLIENPELRDSIIRYFTRMELIERIVDKNNAVFVDDIYNKFLVRAGITVQIFRKDAISALARAGEILTESFGADVAYPEDRVLSQAADSDSWNDIRRNVILRARIIAVGLANSEETLVLTDDIAEAIASELRQRP
ncbi:MAG: hypothetical protein KJO09_06730 [Gammaproteobacteria bacterium]|mgnify:FL=1|nr:hypothetical protein [Gammaproteobacteria bacterium]